MDILKRSNKTTKYTRPLLPEKSCLITKGHNQDKQNIREINFKTQLVTLKGKIISYYLDFASNKVGYNPFSWLPHCGFSLA